MKIKSKTVCFNCMMLSDDMDLCTNCGLPISGKIPKQEKEHTLRMGTILNNAYLVGKAFYYDGFFVRYQGLDTVQERPINIIELFPWDLSERYDDGISVSCNKNPEGFAKVSNRFQKRISTLMKINLDVMEKILTCFQENNTTYIITTGIPQETPNLTQIVEKADQRALMAVKEMALNIRQLHKSGFYCGILNPNDIHVSGGSVILPLTFPEFSRYSTRELHTSPYIAPEVFEGVGVGARSDVYFICALLYRIHCKKTLPDANERKKQSSDIFLKELKKARTTAPLTAAFQKGLMLDSGMREDRLDDIISLMDDIIVSKEKGKSAASQNKSMEKGLGIIKKFLLFLIVIIIGMILLLVIAQTTLNQLKKRQLSFENKEKQVETLLPVESMDPTRSPETMTPIPTYVPTTAPPVETEIAEVTSPPKEPSVDPVEKSSQKKITKKANKPKRTKKPVPAKHNKKKRQIKHKTNGGTRITKRKRYQSSSEPIYKKEYTENKKKQKKSVSKKETPRKTKKPVIRVEQGDGTKIDWIK